MEKEIINKKIKTLRPPPGLSLHNGEELFDKECGQFLDCPMTLTSADNNASFVKRFETVKLANGEKLLNLEEVVNEEKLLETDEFVKEKNELPLIEIKSDGPLEVDGNPKDIHFMNDGLVIKEASKGMVVANPASRVPLSVAVDNIWFLITCMSFINKKQIGGNEYKSGRDKIRILIDNANMAASFYYVFKPQVIANKALQEMAIIKFTNNGISKKKSLPAAEQTPKDSPTGNKNVIKTKHKVEGRRSKHKVEGKTKINLRKSSQFVSEVSVRVTRTLRETKRKVMAQLEDELNKNRQNVIESEATLDKSTLRLHQFKEDTCETMKHFNAEFKDRIAEEKERITYISQKIDALHRFRIFKRKSLRKELKLHESTLARLEVVENLF